MPHNCLNEEILLDYIEQRLPTHTRDRVEKHLSQCVACRDMLMLAVELDMDEAKQDLPTVPAAITQRAVEAVSRLSAERNSIGRDLLNRARRILDKGASLAGDMVSWPQLQPAPVRSGTVMDSPIVAQTKRTMDGIDLLIETEKTGVEQFSITIALVNEIRLHPAISIELFADKDEFASTSIRDEAVVFEAVPSGRYRLIFTRKTQRLDTYRFELKGSE